MEMSKVIASGAGRPRRATGVFASWRPLILAAGAVLGSATAQARDCVGVSFPEQLQADGASLVLNGLGLRQATMFKVNVYVAALYLPARSTDANAIITANGPRELILQFVRDVDASDLRGAWEEGFAKNAGSQLAGLKDRIAQLNGWMSAMKTGQRLAFSYRPGAGVRVSVNGTAKGTIAGDDFARALFSLWLGPQPPNPEVRAGLLGGACG